MSKTNTNLFSLKKKERNKTKEAKEENISLIFR